MHGTRFTDKYLQARHALNRSTYASYTSLSSPSSPRLSSSPAKVPPSSPPRKVVTDFAAFGAPKTASVFGTAVATTPFSLAGGKAAFGGLRPGVGRGMLDDDEDEDEGGSKPQKVELREDSISYDQAKRIAMQSAWRNVRG